MNIPEPTKFPHAPPGWTPEDAVRAAEREGMELTPDHWEEIAALQEYFSRHERVNLRELTDALEEHFHDRGGRRFLYQLFPGGPVAQGCRLAGLEAPAGVVDQGFGSVV